MPSDPASSPSVTTPSPPLAEEPEYNLAMEHGFQLDATQHHIHFADRGKFSFTYKFKDTLGLILIIEVSSVFLGEVFDVLEFAHLHICLDLNRSLTLGVDVCQSTRCRLRPRRILSK